MFIRRKTYDGLDVRGLEELRVGDGLFGPALAILPNQITVSPAEWTE